MQSPEQARYFGTTQWTMILQAKDLSSPENDQALERMCRAYWYPLYSFARRKGNNTEDAQDLVQGFFQRLLEKDYLRSVERDRGKFRTFLLTCFCNFMTNEYEKSNAQKRGGNAATFSIDALSGEERYQYEPAGGVTPDQAFEREWAQTVVDLVLSRLRLEYEKAGIVERFDALASSLMGGQNDQSYETLGAKLGLSANGVKTLVRRMRLRFRELLREELRQTIADPAGVDEELRHMLEALTGV
jgi:RNA polymerase sigma factor (sigma-70 family)